MAPIWHVFAPLSYVPPFPKISDYSDAANRDNSRQPDFSEFKDPWEEYSPRNDSFSINNGALSDNNEKCYCGVKHEEEMNAVHQNDHNATQLAHNQQFHFEKQHYSHATIQTHDQEHATSYSGENRNQEHSIQHSEPHHWQQHEHHVEQHNEQWTEQRHNEQQYCNEQRHSEHHQQFHQHDCHRKANDHHQHQSAEVRHENHVQHHAGGSNQASHQNTDHPSHISHNESHAQHTTQDRDNFASHCCRCNEKSSEQALEAANMQTDTRRIDFPPPSPAPCTDLHNVATRSDPNVTEHLDNANVSNCSHIFFFSKFESNLVLLYVFVHISENISASFC